MADIVSVPLTVEATSDRLPDAIARAERDEVRIVLTRDGEPVAAIIPLTDLRALDEVDAAEDAYWSRMADERIARWEAEGRPPGIPMEEIARELGVDLTEES
ncbi:MAG: type II toxin-antitoxin system Phd/YefM family antitoxin [Acetobacteraceae bacterium]|nr:type II toxin-antitoxin system Phd/YefM family antitoxin [Acetobacteraceae bacterium]